MNRLNNLEHRINLLNERIKLQSEGPEFRTAKKILEKKVKSFPTSNKKSFKFFIIALIISNLNFRLIHIPNSKAISLLA